MLQQCYNNKGFLFLLFRVNNFAPLLIFRGNRSSFAKTQVAASSYLPASHRGASIHKLSKSAEKLSSKSLFLKGLRTTATRSFCGVALPTKQVHTLISNCLTTLFGTCPQTLQKKMVVKRGFPRLCAQKWWQCQATGLLLFEGATFSDTVVIAL